MLKTISLYKIAKNLNHFLKSLSYFDYHHHQLKAYLALGGKKIIFSKAEMLKHKKQGVISQGRNKSGESFKSNNRITTLVLKIFYGNEMHVLYNVCRPHSL